MNQRASARQSGSLPASYLNFSRDPYDPFLVDSTLNAENVASFSNSGDGATWTPFDVPATSEFNPPGEFPGTLAIGSSIITGISSTAGLDAGDFVPALASPLMRLSKALTVQTSVTISADLDGQWHRGSQSRDLWNRLSDSRRRD